MRGYSLATAALALDVDPKWLDNLLSQNRVDGVRQTRQGVQRRIAPDALYVIATVHDLSRQLRVPVVAALQIAHELWRRPPETGAEDFAELRIGTLAVQVDRRQTRARIEAALADALEMAPRTRRGRPPRKAGRQERRLFDS